MPPTKDTNMTEPKRDVRISLTPAQYDALQRASQRDGFTTVTAYVRATVVQKANKEAGNDQ